MNKYVATAGVAAALLGGSLAVAAVNPLTLAGAQDSAAPTVPADPTPPVDPSTAPWLVHPLDAALEELVADGTITREQADAVAARTEAKREELGGDRSGHPGDRGGRGARFGGIGAAADAVASQLGITTDELHEALRSGTSLNELAADHDVAPAAIAQAIVDAAEARIDAALAEGRITQEQADAARTKVADTIDAVMDGTGWGPGPGPGPELGGRGPAGAGRPGDGGGA